MSCKKWLLFLQILHNCTMHNIQERNWLPITGWATKGQLISEWIYEVIVSPKIQTKNCQDFCCPHYTGQISWQFFFHILGETMTSSIYSENSWPLVVWRNAPCRHWPAAPSILQKTEGQLPTLPTRQLGPWYYLGKMISRYFKI